MKNFAATFNDHSFGAKALGFGFNYAIAALLMQPTMLMAWSAKQQGLDPTSAYECFGIPSLFGMALITSSYLMQRYELGEKVHAKSAALGAVAGVVSGVVWGFH